MSKTDDRVYARFLAPVLLVLVIAIATRTMVGDVAIYKGYASGFLARLTFPREYPPLSLVPMLLPEFLSRWLHIPYTIAWLGISAAVLATLARVVRHPLVLIALLITSGPLLGTYDLWPILAMILAYLTIDENPGLSWFLLGLAIALKLFPILFIPLWWQRNNRGWAYGLIPLVTLYPPAMWSVFHYQFARQAEWESTVSLLSWILGPSSMVLKQAFGAVEYFNALSPVVSLVLDGIFVALFAWIAFLRKDLPLIVRMIMLLSFWFLTNKVISVQYVFWVMFLAFLYGRHLWHWILLGWATGALYPVFTSSYSALYGVLQSHHISVSPMSVGMLLVGFRLVVWVILLARMLIEQSSNDRPARTDGQTTAA